ncbi:hypothetical protein [Runella sp.]|uniref:hypothetical protein n=1 Tax=Runella sp. TaxID=1960881 RepID=UPI003D0ED984
MSNTEQFDEWIRGEMESLDSSPENFRQSAIWQKLQTELHPAPEKKPFFLTGMFTALKASNYRISAAAALLFLAGGVWWKTIQTPNQPAVDQSVVKKQSISPIAKEQPLIVAENNLKKENLPVKKHILSQKQPKEQLSGVKISQAIAFAESNENVGTDNVGKVLNRRRAVLADVPPETPIEISITQLPETTPQTNKLTAKITAKPKFKIVHANELADYQKAEIAEAREKEAKARGFIVINWKANANNQSESTLTSYFKNKSSKAD